MGNAGNWTKAHLKSEIRNFKLDTRGRGGISSDSLHSSAVQSAISDFGFKVGFCPISRFSQLFNCGFVRSIDASQREKYSSPFRSHLHKLAPTIRRMGVLLTPIIVKQ